MIWDQFGNHEILIGKINNPINFISGNVHPLQRDINDIFTLLLKYNSIVEKNKLKDIFKEAESLKKELDYDYLTKEINKLLVGIKEGAHRTTEIVKGLRSFSRIDEDEFRQANIIEGIESTLTLLTNKTKNRINIHKEFDEIPNIECLPGKLNQVFMNVLNNSIQAIENKGDIYINIKCSNKSVFISIKDSGKGIAKEAIDHIFEPFYTTKEVGKGTGLGLSISYGIVETHHGKIDVKSEIDKGTEFKITLPLIQSNNS